MKRLIICVIGMVIMANNVFGIEDQIFSVSADAIIRVAPDKVVLQIGAETRGKNLTEVKQDNFDIIKNAIEILKRSGIEDKYIGTDHVDIHTYYEDRYERDLRFIVSQSLTIIITDLSKYDAILAEVVDAGINQVYSIEFQTDELKKYRYEARSLAIAAAKEKAEFFAREAGFQLGKVINLRETTSDYYWRPRSNDRSGMSQNMVQIQANNETEGESGTLAPGMISIRSNITLQYRVE